MTYSNDGSGTERLEARAAIFVDYESIYETLDETLGGRGEPHGLIGEMIEALLRSLQEDRETRPAVSHAYADFTTMGADGDNVQRALYVQGVEPRYVPRSVEANTIEIQLCVDAMDLMHHRSDVTMFVLLTGRRAYLPLVRTLRGHGRDVLVAGLDEPPSRKGVPQIDGEWYFPARDLLSTASRHIFETSERGEQRSASSREIATDGAASVQRRMDGAAPDGTRTDGLATDGDRTEGVGTNRERTDGIAAGAHTDGAAPPGERTDGVAPHGERTDGFTTLEEPIYIRTLQIIEEYFGQYEEVYLTPLLRKMSELLDERKWDPKTIVGHLEDCAAVRLEKREGVPHDYTVLILDADHPDVHRVRADGQNGSYYYEDARSDGAGSSDGDMVGSADGRDASSQ